MSNVKPEFKVIKKRLAKKKNAGKKKGRGETRKGGERNEPS